MHQTNDARVFLGKVDTTLSPAHRAEIRYAYSTSEQINGTFDVPTWTVTANGIEQDSSHSIVGQVNSVFGPTLLNEAKAQYAREPGRGRTRGRICRTRRSATSRAASITRSASVGRSSSRWTARRISASRPRTR